MARGTVDRTDRSLSTVARLLPNTSLAAARADLQGVAQRLQADLPAAYPTEAHWSLDLTPLRQSQFGHMLAPLGTLMAAAAVLLLIASVNVAIMFLLRAAVRRREIMVRIALGATRWHIIRQALVESAVVCALGTATGGTMAVLGLEVLKKFPPASIPRLQDVTIDGPVAAFTAGVMLIVTMAVGLAPAFAALRTRVNEGGLPSLRSTETRSAVHCHGNRTRGDVAGVRRPSDAQFSGTAARRSRIQSHATFHL
jgi:predicted lysophospholipase L1 biosynthesis ABC-type transport system permease subunit